MSGHTPGPWEARRTGDRWEVFSGTANFEDRSGIVVGWVETSRIGYSTPRDAADAKLIAAAPELRAALERWGANISADDCDIYDNGNCEGRGLTGNAACRICASRAALAKAGVP